AGEGQFAVILGEAGVGKSRLLFELQQVAQAAGARVLTGRGDSARTSTPYLPFIQAIETALSVPPDRSDTTAVHDHIVAAIRAIGAQLEDYVPFLLNLLAIPSAAFPVPQQLQKEDFHASMMEAVTALLTLQARHAPLLLVMEDWHWADDASRQVLHQISDIAPCHSLLVAVSSRPDPTLVWGSGEHQRLIHLGPVGAGASFELLKAVLKVDRVADELAREVLARAGGNPFFIEEICHSLVEDGIVRCASGEAIVADRAGIAHLPDTIQAVIGTRISMLDPVARDVLKVAAVIGTDFPRHILEQLIENGIDFTGSLERLKSAGLIQQTAVVPKPVFRFRHVLIREVAYDSLLERQRSLLHGTAARAIEADAPERADEQADVLAHHFSLAGEWSSAISYATAAADRAARLNEFPHCLAMLDAAREWVVRLPEDDARRALTTDILFRQERACETLGFRNRQQQLVSELVAMLEPAGESEKLAEAYLRQGELHTLLRKFYFAGQDLQTSLRIARALGDAAGERKALRSLGFLRWHESDFPAAIALVQESVELDRSRGDLEALQGDLNNLGQIFKGAGDYPRALECLHEALELSSQRGDVAREAYMLSATGQVYRAMGDLDVALDCLRRCDDSFRVLKLPIQRSFVLISIAHVLLDMGKTDESLQSYREAVDVCRRTRYSPGLAQALRILGEVLATLARDNEAVPCLGEAADLFAHLDDPETEAAIRTKNAACFERLERWSEAHSAWESVRALPRTGGRRAELRAVEGIARTARSAGMAPEIVIKAYEEALELSVAADDRARCGAARNTLGILEWERGGYEAAAGHYAAAREIFHELGDRVHEGLMLNSLGMSLMRTSRLEEARAVLRAALDLNASTGERLLQAHSLSALGELSLSAAELDEAILAYERSLALRREIGDRRGEGWTLFHLAKVRFAQGDPGQAQLLWQSASDLATQLDDGALQLACETVNQVP
ncbi:MAG: ATP-binding protein, partial [Gemmatimonadaceae bacterium]